MSRLSFCISEWGHLWWSGSLILPNWVLLSGPQQQFRSQANCLTRQMLICFKPPLWRNKWPERNETREKGWIQSAWKLSFCITKQICPLCMYSGGTSWIWLYCCCLSRASRWRRSVQLCPSTPPSYALWGSYASHVVSHANTDADHWLTPLIIVADRHFRPLKNVIKLLDPLKSVIDVIFSSCLLNENGPFHSRDKS